MTVHYADPQVFDGEIEADAMPVNGIGLIITPPALAGIIVKHELRDGRWNVWRELNREKRDVAQYGKGVRVVCVNLDNTAVKRAWEKHQKRKRRS